MVTITYKTKVTCLLYLGKRGFVYIFTGETLSISDPHIYITMPVICQKKNSIFILDIC